MFGQSDKVTCKKFNRLYWRHGRLQKERPFVENRASIFNNLKRQNQWRLNCSWISCWKKSWFASISSGNGLKWHVVIRKGTFCAEVGENVQENYLQWKINLGWKQLCRECRLRKDFSCRKRISKLVYLPNPVWCLFLSSYFERVTLIILSLLLFLYYKDRVV